MVGAAGVMITGDDGTPAGGSTSGLGTNNFVEHNVIFDTGDGSECRRGTSNTTYQYNVFFQTSPDTVSPRSQGVECAGNGNTGIAFLYNTFTDYSDGLQLNSATNVTVIGNRITKSTYGITTSGTDVLIQNNVITGNRMGVGSGGNARVTITQNQIYDNGQPILSLPTSAGGTTNPASPALLGIDLGVNGVTLNDGPAACGAAGPDCDTGPNELQNFPILAGTSTWGSGSAPALNGSLQSQPNASYIIEFFASHAVNPAGFTEGEVYVGSMTVTTDASGIATFTFTGAPADPLKNGSATAYFTATATNANRATSEFSSGIRLSR
jgi:hypothetical protein